MKTFLEVAIRGKREVFFKAECESLSLINEVGPFDILPDHINFVSVVTGEVVAKEKNGKIWKKDCGKALLRVTKNKVDLLLFD